MRLNPHSRNHGTLKTPELTIGWWREGSGGVTSRAGDLRRDGGHDGRLVAGRPPPRGKSIRGWGPGRDPEAPSRREGPRMGGYLPAIWSQRSCTAADSSLRCGGERHLSPEVFCWGLFQLRFHKRWTAPDGLATRLIGAPPRCGVFFPLSVRASGRLWGLEAPGARGGSTWEFGEDHCRWVAYHQWN